MSHLPVEEREEALHLQALLHLLDGFIVRFEGALRLHEHCKHISELCAREVNKSGLTHEVTVKLAEQLHWRMIAGREAAMSIYHFSCTLDAISVAVHRCKSIKTALPQRPFRAPRQMFKKTFPHAERMRHAISHTAEMAATLESLRAHATKNRRRTTLPMRAEDSILFAIGPSYSGDRLTLSYKGDDVSVEITLQTRNNLCDVATEIYAAFKDLVLSEDEQQPLTG